MRDYNDYNEESMIKKIKTLQKKLPDYEKVLKQFQNEVEIYEKSLNSNLTSSFLKKK